MNDEERPTRRKATFGEVLNDISRIAYAGSGRKLLLGMAIIPVSLALIGIARRQRAEEFGVSGSLGAFVLTFFALLAVMAMVGRDRKTGSNVALLWRSAVIVAPLFALCLPLSAETVRVASIAAAVLSGLLYLVLLFYWPKSGRQASSSRSDPTS